jgi:hypothetical protein
MLINISSIRHIAAITEEEHCPPSHAACFNERVEANFIHRWAVNDKRRTLLM